MENSSSEPQGHSPEPWTAFDEFASGMPGIAASGELVIYDGVLTKPNVRRIVACVNALAGIDDPAHWVRLAKLAIEAYGEGLEELLDGVQNSS